MSTKTFLLSTVLSVFLLFLTAFLCFADTSTEMVRAAAPDPAGLVAHYEFEGDAVDTAGLQPPVNGTLIGNPTFEAGVFGLAIGLDGDSDYVDCGNGSFFNITDRLTVTAWIKVGQFDKQYQTIISKGDNSWRLARAGKSNKIEFACNGTAANKWNGTGEVPWAVTSVTDVNDGKWHNIAGVFDGSGLYLYVDGILEAAKAAAKSINISSHNVFIGANAQVPGREWNGFIDDVRIYNYALSQAEIVSIMGENEINLMSRFPATLYDIAKRYDGLKKREEAKGVCRVILQNYPESPYASSAQIYILKRNIISLIESGDYIGAQTQLDTLIADFNDHPDTAETLYTVAQAYSPPRKFKEAEDVYRRLLQLFPDSSYATEALFRSPKLHIFYLIQTGKNSEAMSAIDKFTADFAGHPALPGIIYWFAKEFEASKAYEQAKSIYQRVAWQYPGSSHASMSWIGFYRVEAISLIEAGDDTAVHRIIDNLIADFNDHPALPEAVFAVGEQYYYKAFDDNKKCIKVKSTEDLYLAKDIWGKIIAQWPNSKSIGLKHAQYFTAVCYRRLGEYEKAITYYQKVVDNWPDYQYAWSAQYLIGSCYEKLKFYNSLPESEADPKIEQAYKAVVVNYPDSAMVPSTSLKLGNLYLKRGQKIEAAMYFELFLTTARTDDPRIESVKARLEELKGEEK
jgi:tetratricopeptide (TPR) repeat protein